MNNNTPATQMTNLLATIFLLWNLASPAAAQEEIDFLLKTSDRYEDVTVQEIISTDTIVIETMLKKGEKVRLIGLKSPKIEKNDSTVERDEYGFRVKEKITPDTPIEDRAMEFMKGFLLGKKIRLEFDHSKNDEKHYTLAYIFIVEDNTFVNKEILRQGFAYLHIQPPNLKYEEELREAYQESRREKRGLQGQ